MSWRNLRWRHQNKQTKQANNQTKKQPTTGHSRQYSYIFIYTYSLEPEELTPQKDEAWSDDGKKNAAKGSSSDSTLRRGGEEEEKKYFWCSDISHKSCCTLPQVSLLYECEAVTF